MIGAKLRECGHVKRFHTVPTIGFQTVAEHSFHVALLCNELYVGGCSAELLKAALFHDLGEASTGDVPGQIKWANPDLNAMLESMEQKFMSDNDLNVNLTRVEELALKVADALELGFYCVDQIMLGNRGMVDIYYRISDHIGRISVYDTPIWMPLLAIMERLGEKYHAATREIR